jgi:hypothetical protein
MWVSKECIVSSARSKPSTSICAARGFPNRFEFSVMMVVKTMGVVGKRPGRENGTRSQPFGCRFGRTSTALVSNTPVRSWLM